MAMKKLLFVLLIALGIWFDSTEVFSQTERIIELLDFDSNKPVGVNVKEECPSQTIVLTNRGHHILDTIKICNAKEIDTLYIALKRFLAISYRSYGGSGEHLRYTKIFVIKNATLYEGLTLLTRHESFSPDGILQRGYSVSFTINKLKNDYFISLIEEEKKWQKAIFRKQFKLSLNLDFMAFSSSMVGQNNAIRIDEKSVKSNNDILRVRLRKESYIFYRKGWYQQSRKGSFYRI